MFKSATLFVLSALLVLSCTKKISSHHQSPPEILKWVGPNADTVQILISEPPECLSGNQDQQPRNIVLGRAAFRSPFLLGGQAAKQGISCNTCHTNGQRNDDFYIEGLSGSHGTADVTNFHFSPVLGDRIFNPKPIPSLTLSIKPKTAEAQLIQEKFILRLVEKEFAGMSPSQTIKTALITYVRALNSEMCRGTDYMGKELLDFRILVITQELSILSTPENMDQQDEDFLRMSIRAELGRLYERYPKSEPIKTQLSQLSEVLKPLSILEHAEIKTKWEAVSAHMLAEYERSLFSKTFTVRWIAD